MNELDVAVHTSNLGTQEEAVAGELLRVPGQPGLYSDSQDYTERLSEKTKLK